MNHADRVRSRGSRGDLWTSRLATRSGNLATQCHGWIWDRVALLVCWWSVCGHKPSQRPADMGTHPHRRRGLECSGDRGGTAARNIRL